MLQFLAVRSLQTTVLNDETVALNQRAQVANTVANILNKLVDLQTQVYTQERFKSIEAALIRATAQLPEAALEKFLKQYELLLEDQK